MALGAAVAGSRGVLDKIANPQVVNPLAAYQGAAQTAGTMYDLRAKQANEAAGQAYQASINPQTGELDPQEFRRQLAMRPNAAMAAGANLENIQNISSSQLNMQKVALGWYNGALGALDDGASREKILSTIQSGVRSGILDPAVAARETAAVNALPDSGLPGYIQQHRQTAASAMDQFHIQNGTPITINQGGQITGGVQSQRTGAIATSGAGVPLGVTNDFLLQPSTFPAVQEKDEKGVPTGRTIPMTNGDYLEYSGNLPKGTMARLRAGIGSAGPAVGPPEDSSMSTGRPPKALTNPNKPPPAPAPAPAPAVTPPPAAPPVGAVGGGSSLGAPTAPAPAAPPPPSPTPAAPAPTAPPGAPSASNALAQPGVQVATAGTGFVPSAGPAAAPGPAVAGDVNAIMAGIKQAQAARGGAPAVTPAAAPGAGGGTTFNMPTNHGPLTLSPAEEYNLKNSPPQFQKELDEGVKAVSQSAMLGNMLADAANFVPGSDADTVQRFTSRFQYWAPNLARAFGIDPGTPAAKEGFDKIAAQIENAQGAQSDKRMEVVQAATPHSSMTAEGVDQIIRQLQGNSDYLQYRAKMAASYPKQYDYRGFQQDVQQLDPRVFQLTRMTDQQRIRYWASLDSSAQKELGAAIRWKAAKDKELAGQ